ncbi:flagellin [Thioalkalivibrio sp. ALE9]|uniref:flagellin n=1 Tax=Thioalkalivibrio sp. ALE9 TaxID=1158169 RepID=UPI00036B6D3D|nr:flagellin [Thioalkalivibrio sp. ALE9]
MSQVINTNVLSLNAQRNLGNSQGALAQSLERLSSGLRINSAKDDAAGLAISERFSTQIRGLNQAVRNSNDGISFAQTAEGALSTVGDALQRARELAVQAANDSNSASDRQALNDEVQQLMAEVSRIANSTEFNGGRVLDGSVEDLFFQVGANQGQTIAVSGVDSRTSQLGTTEVISDLRFSKEQIEEGFQFIGPFEIVLNENGAFTGEVVTAGFTGPTTLDEVVREINRAIKDASAGNSTITEAGLSAALRVDNEGNTGIVINGAFDAEFDVRDDIFVTDLDGGAIATPVFGDPVPATQVNLTDIDVITRESASQAIGALDAALTQVNSLRAELGAVQVRFESTIDNLSVSAENLSDARSRIRDADFATETAELTRAQVLQQAGTSVLSQANAVPQNVVALLQ